MVLVGGLNFCIAVKLSSTETLWYQSAPFHIGIVSACRAVSPEQEPGDRLLNLAYGKLAFDLATKARNPCGDQPCREWV